MASLHGLPEYVSDDLDWMFLNNDLLLQDQYGDPSMYHTAAAPMYYEAQPAYYQPAPPPRHYTPSPGPHGYVDSGIHTRSGRALGSPETPKRNGRDTPAKRPPKRRIKAPKAGAHHLEVPLSELTKDYSIPVKDMDKWVNRSAEDRRKESEKKNGYISRPMNSFMLYRSAYAERVKQFCKENNHQVVSQVTGASWPMEPDAVRKEYERLSILERDNHAAAFPDYKFAPNKNGKKRGREDEDDSDGEWGGSSRTKRSRTVASSRGVTPSSRAGTPFDDYYSPSPYQHAVPYNPSAYDHRYPRGPAPPQFHDPLGYGQYYQQNVRQYAPQVEDVTFNRVENAFPPQDQMLGMIGMPQVDAQHLLGDEAGLPVHMGGDMLDPRLGQEFQIGDFQGLEPVFTSPRQAGYAAEAYHPGQATLTEAHNVWDEAGQAGSDFDRALNHYG